MMVIDDYQVNNKRRSLKIVNKDLSKRKSHFA